MPQLRKVFYKRILLLILPALLMFCAGIYMGLEHGSKTATVSNSNGSAGNISRPQENDLVNRGESDRIAEAEMQFFKDKVVMIDAGHGGIDSGTSFGDVEEKNINMDVALKLAELLKSKGINVHMTRETDEYVGINERAYMANDVSADLFISVHCNSVENLDESCSGTETLYKTKDKSGRNGMDSQTFAGIVQKELVDSLGTRDNGVLYRSSLGVLILTKMPCTIAEIGYLSNPEERARLGTWDYQQDVAEALASGVVKTLKQMYGID